MHHILVCMYFCTCNFSEVCSFPLFFLVGIDLDGIYQLFGFLTYLRAILDVVKMLSEYSCLVTCCTSDAGSKGWIKDVAGSEQKVVSDYS